PGRNCRNGRKRHGGHCTTGTPVRPEPPGLGSEGTPGAGNGGSSGYRGLETGLDKGRANQQRLHPYVFGGGLEGRRGAPDNGAVSLPMHSETGKPMVRTEEP